jgi:hypothetical protein
LANGPRNTVEVGVGVEPWRQFATAMSIQPSWLTSREAFSVKGRGGDDGAVGRAREVARAVVEVDHDAAVRLAAVVVERLREHGVGPAVAVEVAEGDAEDLVAALRRGQRDVLEGVAARPDGAEQHAAAREAEAAVEHVEHAVAVHVGRREGLGPRLELGVRQAHQRELAGAVVGEGRRPR